MSSKGPIVLVLTFWLPCLLSHTRKTLWYYWFPRESWKQISRAMTEQAKVSTQRALEPRSAGGAAVGADGRGEQKGRLRSRQNSDPSSLWLEWRHEEGWDGARGKAKSRSWRLEALLVIVLELLLLDIVHCLLISAVTIWLQTLTHLGWWGLCCC